MVFDLAGVFCVNLVLFCKIPATKKVAGGFQLAIVLIVDHDADVPSSSMFLSTGFVKLNADSNEFIEIIHKVGPVRFAISEVFCEMLSYIGRIEVIHPSASSGCDCFLCITAPVAIFCGIAKLCGVNVGAVFVKCVCLSNVRGAMLKVFD